MAISFVLDIDECFVPDGNGCDTNALCTNTEGSYVCRCLRGYQGNGRTCEGEASNVGAVLVLLTLEIT